jgi:hypothetical protein
MATTDILAALIGLYFICGGMALLTDRKAMAGMMHAFTNQPALAYLGGVMAFITGGAILAVHSSWGGLLAGFVTLVGWVALIEGVLLIAARQPFLRVVSKINYEGLTGTLVGGGIIILGGVLLMASLV